MNTTEIVVRKAGKTIVIADIDNRLAQEIVNRILGTRTANIKKLDRVASNMGSGKTVTGNIVNKII